MNDSSPRDAPLQVWSSMQLDLLLSLDDEGVVEAILGTLQDPHGLGLPALFSAQIKPRLMAIRERSPDVYLGIFVPALRQLGVNMYDLDRHLSPPRFGISEPSTSPEVAALIESTRFPFFDAAPSCPPLPATAHLPDFPRNAWLQSYAAHSAYWAPRAAPTFHKAVGLWVLSTIVARRVVAQMGSTPVYPTLFLSLIANSTQWTKTTAAQIGLRLLRRAGCGHLLAPDRTTPQFLLKLMSGLVPQDYGHKDEEEQAAARHALGFAAQRGWFYEEWGGMLHLMKRTDSPHAELNKLLIVLEGGAESFETGTIQRGLERIDAPYLALLGNGTLRDLAPFMAEGSPWWHDGFWPRFCFITPPAGAKPSKAPRPREPYALPADLLVPLYEWNRRLGSPSVIVEEEREANGKLTGRWIGKRGPIPIHTLTLTTEVYDAYEFYNDAMLTLTEDPSVSKDFYAWYGRAHEKALRVAMLLASLDGQTSITLPYWAEGQAITEEWRRNLHSLVGIAESEAPRSHEAILEDKIEGLCAQSGGMTAREIQKHLSNISGETLQKILKSMVALETLFPVRVGKKVIYVIFPDGDTGNDEIGII